MKQRGWLEGGGGGEKAWKVSSLLGKGKAREPGVGGSTAAPGDRLHTLKVAGMWSLRGVLMRSWCTFWQQDAGAGPHYEGLSHGRVQRLDPSQSCGVTQCSLRLQRTPLHPDPFAGGRGWGGGWGGLGGVRTPAEPRVRHNPEDAHGLSHGASVCGVYSQGEDHQSPVGARKRLEPT